MDLSFIYHYLNVNPSAIPKKQLPQRSSKEHFNAVKDEVTKLKQARAINEVFYPKWLANIVVVKKKKWEVASVCRFPRFEQSLFKRPFPYVSDKPISKCNSRLSLDEFLRRLPGISSNTTDLG